MKTNKKVVSLLENGISADLLSELNESQINSLYKRLVETKKENKEQTTSGVVKKRVTTDINQISPSALNSPTGVNVDGLNLKMDGGQLVASKIGSMTETSDIEKNSNELDEKFESKKQQKYFYSKCGDGKTKEQKKWCKMAKEFSGKTNFKKLPEKKKKETKEEFTFANYLDKIKSVQTNNMKEKLPKAFNPSFSNESKLEKDIMNILENNLSPKISKKDFLKLLSEAGTEESPTIAPPKPKTPTRPSRPATPYDPKPSVQPGPKAKREKLPNWLTFKAIGIKFK